MPLREYPVEYCSETPFVGRRYAVVWNADKERHEYQLRLFEARLTVTPEMMISKRMGSPNGVQVLWQHMSSSFWGDNAWQSVGRCLTMEFDGKKLVGTIGLSEPDVLKYVAGGVETIDKMVNNGLSVGIGFLDNPPVTWKLAEGTREKPDQLRFNAVDVQEVSLTPMPRIYTAGILSASKQGAQPEPEEPSDA